ncbi:hypothetical protein Tco_1040752, partial [Tanacetum coccineum]
DHLKMEMEMEIPSSSNVKLITECSDMTYICYEVMKDLIKVSKLPQTLISYSSSQLKTQKCPFQALNDPVAITDSLATEYDSADESLVYSTPLPPMEKLAGAEPISGPKTIKSILKSNSTLKPTNVNWGHHK